MLFLLFFFRFFKLSILESLIFLPNFLDLARSSLGSAIQAIGIFISSQNEEEHSWIIKSGPMPDGSPGEYIIFFNLVL